MNCLVLASASPRRAELLEQMGLTFSIQPADIDETPGPGETAENYVRRMAREKALTMAEHYPGRVVLGSDTSVVCAGEILGKPASADDARTMLQRLSDKTHQVMTAVALAFDGHCRCELVVTNVRFRAISNDEIDAYVATGEPLDKAGAYGIQGRGGVFVEDLSGSYSAVVGLPLKETAALLEQAGMPVWQSWVQD